MHDQKTVRLALGLLGMIALVTVAGGIYLVGQDRTMPDALIAIASSSVTAVALLLNRVNGEGPLPVTVENVDAEPVPVDPVPAKAARKAVKKRA